MAAPEKILEILLQLTAQLTDDRPLEDFLKAVTDASMEMLPAEHTSVRLLDPSRSMLLSGARSGSGESVRWRNAGTSSTNGARPARSNVTTGSSR